jgi:anthranilate phosphoribosyltransferase
MIDEFAPSRDLRIGLAARRTHERAVRFADDGEYREVVFAEILPIDADHFAHKDGVDRASQAIKSGGAKQKLDEFVAFTRKLKSA